MSEGPGGEQSGEMRRPKEGPQHGAGLVSWQAGEWQEEPGPDSTRKGRAQGLRGEIVGERSLTH